MKYLHSRLALVGVVVAWPLTQLGGCAVKDREFLPNGGTGGSDGGMSGEDSGATGGKGGSTGGKGGSSTGGKAGGSSTGGKAGGSSTGGNGGAAGSTGGKGGATSGGNGGNGGSGNTNAGGEGGQVIDPTCVPTGAEVCNDGIDNDCDTVTDCLTLVSTFPEENGAAAGAQVNYTFQPKHSTATFECRSAQGDTIPTDTVWGACARVSGDTAYPISGASTTADTTNGVWSTEVRLAFPDGGTSRAFRRQIYVHNSLNSESPCPAAATDDDYFDAATPYLRDTGAFDQSTVRNPFVQIKFTPPADSRFYVASGDGVVRVFSLRRRYTFDDTGHYLLITRAYPSRLGGSGCTVFNKRVHNSRGTWALSHHSYQSCTGFVMNSAGAGFCLTAGGTTGPVSAEWVRRDGNVQLQNMIYSPDADNFAWRKLFQSRTIANVSTQFSPKCDVDGCNAGVSTVLFLPDSDLYPYW